MTDEPEQSPDSSPVSVPASDRRAHPRQRVRSLSYVHLGEGNGGIVLNISEGGIAVQAAEALDPAEGPLSLRIDVPRSRKRLEVRGEIVWIGESRKEAGLRFVDLQEDALKRIRSWIAREESPGTAPDEIEDEAPTAQVAEVRAATLLTEESRAREEDPVAEAEELTAQAEADTDPEAEASREVFEAAEDETEPVEFDEESADDFADEPAEVAEDAALTMEAASRISEEPVAAAPVARKQEDHASRIAPPVLTFERKTQAPVAPFTGISGTHGAPAFAVAIAPPAPARFSGGDAGASLFAQPQAPAETAAESLNTIRVQLQSGWFLAALVLLLATISFIAGMAVRRGALNSVMGDVEDVAQPKSAPAPSVLNPATNSSASSSAGAAPGAPAKPLQIEIVDLDNHRWTIPAAIGSGRGDANAARQAQANEAVSPDQSEPAASSAKSPAQTSPPVGSPNAAVAAKPGAPLMLSLPETPISASGSVAIRATRVVAVPPGDAQAAQNARNLQIGELVALVEPDYPPDARQARLEGTVKLHVVVSPNGEVESFRPISGPDSLAHAAMVAVREWRYKPTLLNGKAVETQEDVTFVFRLPN